MVRVPFLALVFVSMVCSGCFQTQLHAPLGRQVRLLAQDEPAKFHTEYKNWYLVYGFVPIWTTQPEEIIRKQNLVEVRARTQDTVSDAIITAVSMLLPLMIFPQHVIVEGNRQSDLVANSPVTQKRAVTATGQPAATTKPEGQPGR
jgi:hypothetical protein